MTDHRPPALGRRRLLQSGGAATFALLAPLGPTGTNPPATRGLTAAAARANLVGGDNPATAVWAYDGAVPGPALRIRQGERLRVRVRNQLAESTTVHWHGIRLPNAMDGVPGLTQPPIRPGESFLYEFAPPDAGTFWYHPHMGGAEQLGRGLAGALIVEEAAPPAVDRDLLWSLTDWRLMDDAQIAPGFGGGMDAGMNGRVGNTVTLNGGQPERVAVRAGERVRLRLANMAIARIMALRFEGHAPTVIALDGQPCEPHAPADGRVLLGPAMRADLLLELTGTPGRRYRVTDDFYQGLGYTLVELAYDAGKPVSARSGPPVRLAWNPVPEPDLHTAERHVITLQGGMMSGMGGMGGMGGGMGGMGGMGGGAMWSLNGVAMTGDGAAGMQPTLTLARGRSCLLQFHNETAWWHPMHLHGHSFRVLSRNGAAVPHREYGDTVLVPPRQDVEVAFVADNPGDWMLHCHVMDHQVAGLMGVIRVA